MQPTVIPTYIPRPRWEVEKGSVSIVRRHATVIHTYIPRPRWEVEKGSSLYEPCQER